jgi:hypothetical protein
VKVLSHRGYWKVTAEKNSPEAFDRSFRMGFGTETDIRDAGGRLVISHDPPAGPDPLPASTVLDLLSRYDVALPLALNVKADGLQRLLREAMDRYPLPAAFVFDMSVPDLLQWSRAGVPYFTRHSDVEPEPSCYAAAKGVWLDAFHGDWWAEETIARHLDAGKQVCIVSPELHGRDRRPVWERLEKYSVRQAGMLMICTDHPEDARRILGSED